MHELLRTNDPVLVSFVEALLREQGIDYHVADINTSAVEGSIAIFPRRIIVGEEAIDTARSLLLEAGLGSELPDADRAAPGPAQGRLAQGYR